MNGVRKIVIEAFLLSLDCFSSDPFVSAEAADATAFYYLLIASWSWSRRCGASSGGAFLLSLDCFVHAIHR